MSGSSQYSDIVHHNGWGASGRPWLQPRGVASEMSLALLVALGDLEAQWVSLEPSMMPLLGGPQTSMRWGGTI